MDVFCHFPLGEAWRRATRTTTKGREACAGESVHHGGFSKRVAFGSFFSVTQFLRPGLTSAAPPPDFPMRIFIGPLMSNPSLITSTTDASILE